MRFVDTNVLLAATARHRAEHLQARATLERGFALRDLALSGQVVREYLVVATRLAATNGLALPLEHALHNIRSVLARALFLPEDLAVRDALLELLVAVPTAGKPIHDANVAATLVAHRVPVLITLNGADFAPFARWFRVEPPRG